MFEIDEKVLQELLNYLAGRPYVDVYQLVAALQQCKKIEKEEEQK